jgi:enamine deaminase RidA (YjgF/YER057c/UK114 family)
VPADWKQQVGCWDRSPFVRVGIFVLAFALFAVALVQGRPHHGENAMRHHCRSRRLARMTPRITRSNPPQLHEPPGYHHITVVEAGRTAHLAGQCPIDRSGALVGPGDLEAQIDQVVANALMALAAAGAEPGDVVRSVVYVVYVVSDDASILGSAWHRLTSSPLGEAFTSASTLLGVTQLGFPGQLVEVDLTVSLS